VNLGDHLTVTVEQGRIEETKTKAIGEGPMTTSHDDRFHMNRRELLGYSAAIGVAAGLRPLGALAQESPLGVNADQWTPKYI
jgi:hypothetical protein